MPRGVNSLYCKNVGRLGDKDDKALKGQTAFAEGETLWEGDKESWQQEFKEPKTHSVDKSFVQW